MCDSSLDILSQLPFASQKVDFTICLP